MSLFALIPGCKIGWATLVLAIVGLTFITASLLFLVRARGLRWREARDIAFLVGLMATFVLQFLSGLRVLAHPHDAGTVRRPGARREARARRGAAGLTSIHLDDDVIVIVHSARCRTAFTDLIQAV